MSANNNSSFYKVKIQKDVLMKTRDGIQLAADIYSPIPKADYPTETFPVLLIRSPYDKSFKYNLIFQTYTITTEQDYFPQRGYILVIQDCRGRFRSEGTFYPFKNEAEDGYDAVEWCATLPGSNGKVGTVGQSYMGYTQLALATTCPPSLRCQCVVSGFIWLFDNCVYKKGVFEFGFLFRYCNMLAHDMAKRANQPQALLDLDSCYSPDSFQKFLLATFGFLKWEELCDFFRMALTPLNDKLQNTLPLSDTADVFSKNGFDFFADFLKNNQNNEFWANLSGAKDFDKINVPIFHVGSWYDYFQDTTLNLYQKLSRNPTAPQKLLMGPWGHLLPFSKPNSKGAGPDLDFGPKAKILLHDEQLKWFDYHLKGIENGVLDEKPVSLFVMGKNDWIGVDDWPIPNTQNCTLYLAAKGKANSLFGTGHLIPSWENENVIEEYPEETDTFIYDPKNPVPTLGGTIIGDEDQMGAHDQTEIEQRDDVLVFTGLPVQTDLEISGKVIVSLFASTSCVDTDFTAKLCDVHPKGYVQNLCDGIVRASFRKPDRIKKLKPNKSKNKGVPSLKKKFFRSEKTIKGDISNPVNYFHWPNLFFFPQKISLFFFLILIQKH